MIVYLQMIETPEEQSKFEVLYCHYRGLMFHVANRMLDHAEDAEDAVHTAFMKVAENIRKVDAPVSGRTKAYLITILEHQCIDMIRKRERDNHLSLDELDVGIPFEYEGADAVAACIAQMPPQYRHVLELKYRHGFNNREVASILDISVANAIKIDQRAKKRLEVLCYQEELL